MTTPDIALIGCGAIAEVYYTPALQRRPELARSLILVDRDLARAERMREAVGAAAAVSDYRDVLSCVRGAIIATPHHLHHPLTLDLVRAGAHVLCEKPLAETAAQVDEIVAAARTHGVHVAVNHTRRLFSSFREIERLVRAGELGELREIHYELGEPFAWPAATDAYFGRGAGGRGVLFDTGAHIVDLVCWWLGGEPEIVAYEDDARGGTEAVARMVLRRGAATAHVHLSWLTKLRNQYRLTGTAGSIAGGVYEWSSFMRQNGDGRTRRIATDRARTLIDFFEQLLTNFFDVVAGAAQPLVTAADARAAVAVIDGCYARRARFEEPWHDACQELSHV